MQKIDENLVDIIFKTIKMNLKTTVSGALIEFKFNLTESKSFIYFRVRKNTFDDFVKWINKIHGDTKE